IDRNAEYLLNLKRAAVNDVLQRVALEIFHDDEGLLAFFADVVNRANVGMIEGGGGLSLAAKPAEGNRIAGDVFRKKLERNEGAEPRFFSFVDDTHPATAEFFDHSVVRDVLADHVVCSGARTVKTPNFR